MHKLVFALILTIFCYDFGGIFYVNGQNTAGQIPCSCANCSDWILSTTEFAQDGRLKATIANGFVGFRVTETAMHVNGFYHGYLTSSTRVRVPNHLNLPITFAGNITYSLNMQKGLFEELIVNDQLGVNVSAVSYASLADKHFLVTEITIQSGGPIGADVNVGIQSLPFQVTSDINVTNDSDSPDKTFHIFQAVPAVLETENVSTPNLTTFTTNPPQSGMITLSKGQTFIKFVFYSAITINNYTLAQNLFNQGKDLAKTDANETTGFMSAHVAEWNRVWQNRFEINGNCDLAGKMRASYYYILSSLPIGSTYGDDGWPFFGISPGSLVNDDGTGYHGHVFWDQDLWMLIGLLPLHPEVVKQTLIDSRIRHIEPAKLNAQRFGYDGLMYPWELAYSGYECDPSHETAIYEIHVTGDSALCAQQYLQLTGDKNFAQMYYNTSLEIAKFYNSILKPTQNTYLGIYNIMGPDEYHSPVNNSAYMNSIAKIALGVPSYIKNTFSIIGDSPDPNWNQNMGKIYLPFDNTRQYHPEYDSYTTGTVIKQADTVLLGYPLLLQMDPVVRKNDLVYYQSVTDGGGPAMTWAMHSIGWLEYGAEKNASDMFKKNFNYMRAPFNIWTETTSGVESVNFVTGMGGFMHNLLQGYLGLRIYPDRLEFNPFLIPDSGSYSAIGVAYQGMSFTFDVNDTIVQVSLISAPKTGCVLVDENGKQFGLNTGVVFTGAIKTKRKITCNPSGSCSCPSGAWYQSTINPCNCYNFVKTPKDWKSANNDCQQQNSRSTLASIDSAFENNEVLVKGQNQTGCTQFFIGLQEPSSNVWTWINNDTAIYRNWRSGYPDTNVNNKCSQLNSNDGKWTNIDCSTTGCYVCEIKNN